MDNFSVIYRDIGDWDIWQNKERIYKIRSSDSSCSVSPAGSRAGGDTHVYGTVLDCMNYICYKLME